MKSSKLGVAQHLLQRAKRSLLVDHDPVTSLVLAGSAEDLLQGLLTRAGKVDSTARHTVANVAPDLIKQFVPDIQAVLTPASLTKAMRGPFNWLRHADRPDEPMEIDANWDYEATCALLRGALNHMILTDVSPFDESEIIRLLWMMAEDV